MTPYNHTLTLRLPVELADIAAKIGKALDPDSGGERSFVTNEDGLTISTSTPCTEAFYTQAQAMLTNPSMLHAAVSADYATRWPDLVAPTLAECEQFVQAVIPEPEVAE